MNSIDTSDIGDIRLSLCYPENIPDIDCSNNREALERLLRDGRHDHRLRCAAAHRLGDIGSTRSTEALLCALEDKYPIIRFESIAALGKIGGKHACEALSNLLDCDNLCIRRMAARALIQLSGVPDSRAANLEKLMKLICSGDERVKRAVLDIGSPSINILFTRLGSGTFSVRQEASATLALHIRELVDQTPQKNVFLWLDKNGFSTKSIADLYSFRIIRKDGTLDKIENSGFDVISKTLCGDRSMLRLSPGTSSLPMPEVSNIDLADIISEHGLGELKRIGRTLVAPFGSSCFAIKLCMNEADAANLAAEAQMQRMLATLELASKLPQPLGGLFRLQGLRLYIEDLKPWKSIGICYIVDSDYFRYLGDPEVSIDETKAAMVSCAKDLGRLARRGIIHKSLIPLFHNRERSRGDSTYRWNRKVAGRLDNWLESCTYPNLRLSGIADFEHFKICPEISAWELQSYSGEHLLSMSLVLGSYFWRRDRFDEDALASMLKECFIEYCYSLAGSYDMAFKDLFDCICWNELTQRMAEEMDQQDKSRANICGTGPHLGRLNGPFPIPELIKAIHIASLFAVLELQVRE